MQYKEAMDRMKRMNCTSAGPPLQRPLPPAKEAGATAVHTSSLLPSVETGGHSEERRTVSSSNKLHSEGAVRNRTPLANQVVRVMKVIVPFKIVLIIAKIALLLYFLEDTKRLLAVWYMPLLGVGAACLANCVPIGGGIVYVPALAMLGSEMKLGVSFSVATMTVGNGIFGYLNWQKKNSSLLVWEAIPYTVLPSSVGTLASLLVTPPSEARVKIFFALFCFLLALFVFFSVRKGGIAQVMHNWGWCDDTSGTCGIEIMEKSSASASASVSSVSGEGRTWKEWLLLVFVSFLAGLVLVPNIAIGPSLTTFLGLVLLGFQEEEAMVTGIVVGGWASIVPFLLHMCYYRDVPWDLWLMVLPGVALGAWLAPKVQTFIGIENSLISFGAFLLCTFALFMTH
jgi:uncharacterized membrane protein YfcA